MFGFAAAGADAGVSNVLPSFGESQAAIDCNHLARYPVGSRIGDPGGRNTVTRLIPLSR
jgi:hypothetical protein